MSNLAPHRSFEDSWREVSGYLDEVLDLEPGSRQSWLDDLETRAPGVATEIRSLLLDLAKIEKKDFLGHAVAPVLAGATLEGQRFGSYTLDRLIGHGGMGTVWLAHRSDGRFKGEAAVKLLNTALVGHPSEQRFNREGNVLAKLQHPNIAHLLDAGVAAGSQPYLVLEYVSGERIDHYCEKHQLGIEQRIRLFLDVLGAVEHAHSNLIVHRDLKPSNILVTERRVVKLLDFGIAALLSPDNEAAAAQLTHHAAPGLTPGYAAPEQLLGEAVTTATDVYGLGLVLFVLLAGRHPVSPEGKTAADLIRLTLDGEVPLLSDVATDARRGRQLRGDLDNIIAMALRRNPTERYTNAQLLAQDLRRYLALEPVSARPRSLGYLAAKFVRRNRSSVAAAITVVLVLVGAVVFAFNQAGVATAQRDRAIELAERNAAVTEFLGTMMTDAVESQTPITVSEVLARSERLALQDGSDTPENRAAVLNILAERYWNLHQEDRAAQLMEHAIALLNESQEKALRSRYVCKLAAIRGSPENVASTIQVMTREVAKLDADPEAAAGCLSDLALVAGLSNRAEDMLRYASRGLALLTTTARSSRMLEAELLGHVAMAHHFGGRNFEAQQYFERALQKYSELRRERSDAALVLMHNWATMLLRITPRRSLDLYEQEELSLQAREPDAPVDPSVIGSKALALRLLGRLPAAQRNYEAECRFPGRKVHCLLGLASVMLAMNELERAAQYLDQARDSMGPGDSLDNLNGVTYATHRGSLALARGQLLQAAEHFDRVLANRAVGPYRVLALLGKTEVELSSADPAAAVRHAQEAVRLSLSHHSGFAHAQEAGLSWLALGRARQALGDSTQAREAFRLAYDHLSNTVDANHPALLEARRVAGASPPGPATSNPATQLR